MQKLWGVFLLATAGTTLLAGGGCTATDQASGKRCAVTALKCEEAGPVAKSPSGWVCGGGNAMATGVDSEDKAMMPNSPMPVNAPMAAARAAAPVADTFKAKKEISDRLMTYEAGVTLRVTDLKTASAQIVALVKAQGGYVQQQNNQFLVLKVPAAELEKTIAELEKVGRVVDKRISAEDVTDTMFDINTRIDNLEKLREQMLTLLAKSTKMTDMITIEKELARITNELELLKGRKRNMEGRISFSKLTVNLVTELPQQQVQRMIPVAWVKTLGSKVAATDVACDAQGGSTYRPFNCRLPDGFALIMGNAGCLMARAASADGVMMELVINESLKNSTPDFWRKLVRRGLEEVNAFKVVSDVDLKTPAGLPGFRIEAEKKVGGKSYTDVVAVMIDADKDQIYLVECWGETEQINALRKNLDDALKSMQPWRWWQSAD